MPLDETTIARLAFIKYLFSTGVKQSYAPPPLSGISLLSLHDSVELFLQLASEYANIGSHQPNFMDYWDLLSTKIGKELGQRESMRRLNKARVAIKHNGTLPSQFDIEAFRASTVNFFKDNCQIIFGLPLEKISLIELVRPESARARLKIAQGRVDNGDTLTALDEVAIAFSEVMLGYEESHRGVHGESLFQLGSGHTPRITVRTGSFDDRQGALDRQLKEYVEDTNGSINALRGAIKILALGLDYAKYAKFLQMTPHVSRGMTGKYFIDRKHGKDNPPPNDMVQHCIDYVIESAIQIDHVR